MHEGDYNFLDPLGKHENSGLPIIKHAWIAEAFLWVFVEAKADGYYNNKRRLCQRQLLKVVACSYGYDRLKLKWPFYKEAIVRVVKQFAFILKLKHCKY